MPIHLSRSRYALSSNRLSIVIVYILPKHRSHVRFHFVLFTRAREKSDRRIFHTHTRYRHLLWLPTGCRCHTHSHKLHDFYIFGPTQIDLFTISFQTYYIYLVIRICFEKRISEGTRARLSQRTDRRNDSNYLLFLIMSVIGLHALTTSEEWTTTVAVMRPINDFYFIFYLQRRLCLVVLLMCPLPCHHIDSVLVLILIPLKHQSLVRLPLLQLLLQACCCAKA